MIHVRWLAQCLIHEPFITARDQYPCRNTDAQLCSVARTEKGGDSLGHFS